MDEKRCPKCGMTVEGYQTKCECGFVFEGKSNEELKQMSKSAERNRTIGYILAVPLLLAGVFAKALVSAGYYWILVAAVAVLLTVIIVCYLIERRSKK
ncbi:MAG: hypothetical protein J6S14_11770 [Clostridia bacterium]|nr:hypothetical protein [Clostridia bacterium]